MIKHVQGEDIDSKHSMAINRDVLKSDVKVITVDEEVMKGNEKATKDNEKAIKGNKEAY